MKNRTNYRSLWLLIIYLSLPLFQLNLLAQNAPANNDYTAKCANISFGINTLLANKNLANSNYGLSVYSLDKNQFIYQKNSEALLTPASTTKLFHMISAFRLFGENGSFSTDAYIDGEITDGTLNGDLYLVGCGDPFLSSANLEDLAEKTLNSTGIKRITGAIYADDSFFDPMTDRKIYSGDRDVVQSMPPVSGLTFEGNAVKILANAAGTPGAAVRLQSIPRSSAIRFSNTARVGGYAKKAAPAAEPKASKTKDKTVQKGKITAKNAKESAKSKAKSPTSKKKAVAPAKKSPAKKASVKKSKGRADLYDFYPQGYEPLAQKYGSAKKGKAMPKVASKQKADAKAPAEAKRSGGLSIVPQYQPNGEIYVSVSGSLSAKNSQSRSFIMPKPAMIAAGFFKGAIEDGGVKVEGGYGVKKLDRNKPVKLAASFKRPIIDAMYPIGKNSDNYVAEHLCKAVGGYLGNNQNSAKYAGLYACNFVDSLTGKKLNCVLNDGSGLSRRNKVTSSAEIALLISASKSPYFNSFYNSLSIAGVDGTLKKRMHGGLAQNNVHAKTGTHGNVSALSGYVKTKSGETLAFSFIFNGGSVGFYKQLENAICELLANS